MKIVSVPKCIKTGYQNIINRRNASKALKEAAKTEEAPPQRKVVTGKDIERILRQESYRKQQAEERASRRQEIKSAICKWHATTIPGLLATAAEAAAIFFAGGLVVKHLSGKPDTKNDLNSRSKLEVIENVPNKYKSIDLAEKQGKIISWNEAAAQVKDSINSKQVKDTIKTVAKVIK